MLVGILRIRYCQKHGNFALRTYHVSGGERGIRTPESFDTLLAFQASALDHYATSPVIDIRKLLDYYSNKSAPCRGPQATNPLFANFAKGGLLLIPSRTIKVSIASIFRYLIYRKTFAVTVPVIPRG